MSMKHYIGTKEVKATRVTRKEYNDYRGWELPSNENGKDEGYLVEYPGGGKANHPDHVGYISWIPEDVFEKAYRLSETFINRLDIELDDLTTKLKKLEDFIESGKAESLSKEVQDLLAKQLTAMTDYHNALVERKNLINK